MYTHPAASSRIWGREEAAGGPSAGEPEDATAVFVRVRPRLLEIAGRILGSVSEAEDVTQEVWLRWQDTDRTVVLNPPALLRTTTVRLSLNAAQSAWKRREYSTGTWFPEVEDSHATPEASVEQSEAVERAVLLLMEALTPMQRAVYVLREGFGYPYRQISDLLLLSTVNARQLFTRAHERFSTNRGGQPVDRDAYRRLVKALRAAAHSGDLTQLEQVLSADAGHDARAVQVPVPMPGESSSPGKAPGPDPAQRPDALPPRPRVRHFTSSHPPAA